MIILPKDLEAGTDKARTGDGSMADHLGVSGELAKVLQQIFPREMSARLVKDLDQKVSDGELLVNYEGDLLLGGRMFVGGKQKSTGKIPLCSRSNAS